MFHRNREENNMNKITKIHTDNAPAAVGPYSQAIAAGGMLYTSGADRAGSGDGRNRRRRH